MMISLKKMEERKKIINSKNNKNVLKETIKDFTMKKSDEYLEKSKK